jgi:6-phosphogluconolactonase
MEINTFENRDSASIAAADHIVRALARRMEAQPAASLVVSGGTTPVRCFEALSDIDADWDNIHVLLSDERWVAADSEDSNERQVRETLLQGRAAGAELHGMYRDDIAIEQRAEQIGEEVRARPFPFACALLGMGVDGHFASLFADADNLDDGLDTDSSLLCMPVSTAASPHPRITLTLAALSRSDEVVLLVFGEDKRQTLESAQAKSNGWPVARLLKQKLAPVSIYWAP